MRRYRFEMEEFAVGANYSGGEDKVISVELGRYQYVWDFSGTFDWDGYELRRDGRWVSWEEQCESEE